MATGWGMDREAARRAFSLGGWVDVMNDNGPPSKGQILEVRKKSALVRLRGANIPRDYKLTELRPQASIRIDLNKTEGVQMPPDIAPRPAIKAANLNGSASIATEFADVLSFFGKVKEAKVGIASAAVALASAERDVADAEQMLRDATKKRDDAVRLRDRYTAALHGVPQSVLDLFDGATALEQREGK